MIVGIAMAVTQRALVPESWLRNKHRGNLAGLSME
jgi:hypothetical protein